MATESSRPLLLPQNRRLRHLRGIWLRNLTIARPKGHTIDDTTLNKTPEKLEALREAAREPGLQQSASSDNVNAGIQPRGIRRRSTVWAGATPDYRQKKLEDVIDGGMVDTFFSLHCEEEDEPIYISEVVEKAMVCNRFTLFCSAPMLSSDRRFWSHNIQGSNQGVLLSKSSMRAIFKSPSCIKVTYSASSSSTNMQLRTQTSVSSI